MKLKYLSWVKNHIIFSLKYSIKLLNISEIKYFVFLKKRFDCDSV